MALRLLQCSCDWLLGEMWIRAERGLCQKVQGWFWLAECSASQ